MDMKPRCVIKEVPTADPLDRLKLLIDPVVVGDLELYILIILAEGIRKLLHRKPAATREAILAVCGKDVYVVDVSDSCYAQAAAWRTRMMEKALEKIEAVLEDDFNSHEEQQQAFRDMWVQLGLVFQDLWD